MSDVPVIRAFPPLFLAKFVKDPVAYLGELHGHYGDLCTKKILGTPHYFLFHPDHAEHVLSTNQSNFRKYPPLIANLAPFLGTANLATTNDAPQWQRDRDLCKTAFEAEVHFERYAETMARKFKASMDDWQKRFAARDVPCPIGLEFDRLALSTIKDTLFHRLEVDIEDTVGHIPRLWELLLKRATSITRLPWIFPSPVKRRYQREVRYFNEAKRKALVTRLQEGKDVDDLLGTLLAHYKIDGTESPHFWMVANHMLTFQVVGFTTMTSAMRWITTALVEHRDEEARIASEVESVCQGEAPRYEDFEKLEYTRAFIMEVLRLNPPLLFLAREVVKEDSLGGYSLPAGVSVATSLYHIHRHPDYWREPERFVPERFLGSPYGQEHHFAYLPFGAGKRSCLGRNFALLELTLLTASMVQRFRFEFPEGFELRRLYVGGPIFARPNLESVRLRERERSPAGLSTRRTAWKSG